MTLLTSETFIVKIFPLKHHEFDIIAVDLMPTFVASVRIEVFVTLTLVKEFTVVLVEATT